MSAIRQQADVACCGCSTNLKEVLENDPHAYFVHDELLAPLRIMYNSLMETGDDSIANGRLLDAMRQVHLPLSCFLNHCCHAHQLFSCLHSSHSCLAV